MLVPHNNRSLCHHSILKIGHGKRELNSRKKRVNFLNNSSSYSDTLHYVQLALITKPSIMTFKNKVKIMFPNTGPCLV